MNNFLIWMRRTGLLCAAIVCAAIAITGTAHAATATPTQTVTANINSAASLTLGSTTVTFTSNTGAGAIAQTEAAITVAANVRTTAAGVPTLTMSASGPLSDGSDTIALSNLTWVGTTDLTASGTTNTNEQTVATFAAGCGTYTGNMTFSLANSWTYPTGIYTTTLTYTLTAP